MLCIDGKRVARKTCIQLTQWGVKKLLNGTLARRGLAVDGEDLALYMNKSARLLDDAVDGPTKIELPEWIKLINTESQRLAASREGDSAGK